MKNNKTLLMLFFALAVAQLFIPAKMIYHEEQILKHGEAFKFKTKPFDPIDPLRGKYIYLRFEADKFNINNKNEWKQNQQIFVVLENDAEGFAKIKNVVKEKPTTNVAFVEATINFVNKEYISINYPFKRFYMEESKAQEAEDLYQTNSNNLIKKAYAVVYIEQGESVLKDVMIDGKSIRDVVLENRE